MAKNRIKSNRVSVLKTFDDDLPSPEEIEKKVEEVTKPKIEDTKKVVVKETKAVQKSPIKTKSPVKKKTTKKLTKTPTENTEVVKFVKIGSSFHRLAKIEAAKKSLSLKAYLELLIEDNSSL